MSVRAGDILIDVSPLRTSVDFRWLYAARLVSILSIGLIGVAVSMQVFELTRSSLHVGLVNLCLAVPMTIGLLWGGVLADRLDRQQLMVSTRGAYVAVVLTFLLNSIAPHPQLGVIYAAALVAGAINGLSGPPLLASLPSLVERPQIAAAGALITVANQVGAVLGPSLGGVVVARWGFVACYTVVAVGAVLTPIVLSRIKPLPPVPGRPSLPVLHSLAEGWRFVRGNRLIRALVSIEIAAALFASPTALFPQLGLERYLGGPEAVGFLYAAPGVGALIGALTSGWTGRATTGRALVIAILVWGAATAAVGPMPALAGALFLLAVAGVGRATSEILRRAMLQHNTPPELQGRIGSVWLIQATVLPSLGNVLLGGATKVMAPTTAILAGGIVCLVVTVWLAVANRELWTGSESIPEAIPIE